VSRSDFRNTSCCNLQGAQRIFFVALSILRHLICPSAVDINSFCESRRILAACRQARLAEYCASLIFLLARLADNCACARCRRGGATEGRSRLKARGAFKAAARCAEAELAISLPECFPTPERQVRAHAWCLSAARTLAQQALRDLKLPREKSTNPCPSHAGRGALCGHLLRKLSGN